jgi:RNA polymerase sigma-70 factor (ECF subfamily)
MGADRTTILQQCLDRLKAGDEGARQELLGRAAERLRRLTRAMLRRDFARLHRFEETDDVLGAAYVRLCRRFETYTPESLAQFFRIAAQEIRRQLIDLVRHYFGPQGPGSHLVAATPPDGWDGAADPVELAAWADFHRVVDTLPADERDVFDLLWYHGLNQTEAAAVLNISTKTLRARLREARLKLGKAMVWQIPQR